MLCRAHKMRDRELLRSIPGNVYLRDIRRMTREFPDRVQWIWVKSHTYRTGPIYRAHDTCDRECGRIAEEGDDTEATPEVAELTRELLGPPWVESRWNLCRQENMRVILSLGAVDEVSRRLEEAGTPDAAQKARRLCGAAADALN